MVMVVTVMAVALHAVLEDKGGRLVCQIIFIRRACIER